VPGKVFQVDLVDSRTGPPFITAQPSAGTVSIGQSVTLSVTAGGSTPFTYQWKRDGSNIGGATSASYTTGALTFADNGAQFACVVTNSFGSVTSNSVTIAVQPVIKVFPNPWRSDRHGGLPITFNGAPPNARLKIYTLSMHWVKTVQGVTTDITWDRTNDAGQHVASGYYLYIVETDDDRQTVHGMFAIIK